jgi:hypothetical protein
LSDSNQDTVTPKKSSEALAASEVFFSDRFHNHTKSVEQEASFDQSKSGHFELVDNPIQMISHINQENPTDGAVDVEHSESILQCAGVVNL